MDGRHQLSAVVPGRDARMICRAVKAAKAVLDEDGADPLEAWQAHQILGRLPRPMGHHPGWPIDRSAAELANLWLDAEEAARSAVGGDEGRKTILWVCEQHADHLRRLPVSLLALQAMLNCAIQQLGFEDVALRVSPREALAPRDPNWEVTATLTPATDLAPGAVRLRACLDAIDHELQRMQASFELAT